MTPHKPSETQLHLKGMAFACGGFFFFSCQDAGLSWLGKMYPPIQLLWLNCLMVLGVLMLTQCIKRGWNGMKPVMKTAHLRVHLVRGFILGIASYLVLTSLPHVPLPNFYTIIFVGPLLAAALSGFFLKEPVGFKKALALLFGFSGLLVALRPGAEGFNHDALYTLAGAVLLGTTGILNRFLGKREAAHTLLFYPMVTIIAMFAIPVGLSFVPIAQEHLGWAFLTACFTTIAFFVNVQSFRLAPIYLLAPCQFLQFLWGVLFQWVLYNNWPKNHIVLGAAMIIISNLVIIYLQAGTRQKANAPLNPT